MTDTVVMAEADCAVLDRKAMIAVRGDEHMAVIRVRGNGADAVYLGFSPAQAVRMGAAFIRAGLRLDPSLSLQAVEDDIKTAAERRPRAIPGEAT